MPSLGRVRLLCLPHAGAGEAVYMPWRSGLPAWVDLVPVALPGRGRRLAEAPLAHCGALTELLYAELQPHLSGPYALFGHSMGALLAYELAHRARQFGGRAPCSLFVSGSASPTRRAADPAWSGSDDEIWSVVRELDGTADELLQDAEWRSLVLPALRADLQLCARYQARARPPLDCPVFVLTGRSDPATRDAGAVAAWCRESQRGGELRCFPGDHFFVHDQRRPVISFITDKLRSWRTQPKPIP